MNQIPYSKIMQLNIQHLKNYPKIDKSGFFYPNVIVNLIMHHIKKPNFKHRIPFIHWIHDVNFSMKDSLN
jgi:hypothetical protein